MSPPRAVEREVVVVGGGLVGLMTALLLTTETKLDVTVLAADLPEPRTDSQRNHAWLQSGLLYVGADIEAARHMYAAGREMHRKLGIKPPSERGIFRFDCSDDQKVNAFLEHARDIHLDGEVGRLSDGKASKRLGHFYRAHCENFEVPDCPFEIGALMSAAREQARLWGATFRIENADIQPDVSAPHGYRLVTTHEVIVPKYAIVSAGSGTPGFLEKLGLAHPLEINRSGLLVLPRADGMSSPLLADRSRELSYVRHGSIAPNGRLVVGDKGRRVVRSEDGLRWRLSRSERTALMEALPQAVRVSSGRIRSTACHKTDRRNQVGKPTVEPWVNEYPEHPGLIFATPGKATMALYTAGKIVDAIARSERGRRGASTRRRGTPSGSTPGKEWREPIRPHFHPDFDDLEDSVEDDPDDE